MKFLTVLDGCGGTVERDIRDRLAHDPALSAKIRASRECARPDMLVISGTSAQCAVKDCSILLMPGRAAAPQVRADCVVSYGMSPKDTLTLSSVGDEECVMVVQRGFITVWGDIVDRQELVVKRGRRSPEHLLAVESAMLLLGAVERQV